VCIPSAAADFGVDRRFGTLHYTPVDVDCGSDMFLQVATLLYKPDDDDSGMVLFGILEHRPGYGFGMALFATQ
jgi:hypothetical protein